MINKCSVCGFETEKNIMTCSSCNNFWTMEKTDKQSTYFDKKNKSTRTITLPKIYDIKDTVNQTLKKFQFHNEALNKFFWGQWLVKGSINFLSAEPGTGKSTFLWQLSAFLKDDVKILYYSWEETVFQVADRLKRLYKNDKDKNKINNINVYYWDNLEELFKLIERDKPDIIVLDSIQTIYSDDKENAKGSLSQQDYCMEKIRTYFKNSWHTWFIIWHVTKDWWIAWKKTLEHLVDWVYVLEWQDWRTDNIRILKSFKSRFGEADNVVVMNMWETWFTIIEPKEALKVFIEESWDWPGSAFTPVLEWNQLFILEVQSLLSKIQYSFPQRVWLWINKQKLDIILAVLMNKTNFQLQTKDIFINIICPFTFKNAHLDLAVAVSIASSLLEKDIKDYIFLWIVWLQGEIRSVPKQKTIIKKLISMWYKKEKIITREKYKDIQTVISEILIK